MDIDHLYLMSYNYKTGSDGKLTNVFDKEKETKKYHQNNIIDCLMTLLLDVENSTHSLYRSIDNDTDLAKSIADKIPSGDSDKHLPYNIGTLREQVSRKIDYMVGKNGIGPFALNITNLILCQLYDILFSNSDFSTLSGVKHIGRLIDADYNYIQSWLGAFINGHVDLIKDNWVSKLNTNPFTWNMLNLLLRCGFGDTTLWFLCQPIIKDMAQASADANSQFLRDPNADSSTWKLRERLTRETLLKYMSEAHFSESYLNRLKDSKYWEEQVEYVQWMRDNVDVLEYIATHPGEQTFTVNSVLYNLNDVQRRVFYAWKVLEPYSISMGNFVQLTKIDTRRHGKSFIEIRNYLSKYKKFFYLTEEQQKHSIWNFPKLKRFISHSWIDKKTNLAINLPFEILGKQTFEGNSQFINEVIRIGDLLSDGESVSNDVLKKISRHLQTKIKSLYFIEYAKKYLGFTDEDLTGLFVGKSTMADRLNSFIYHTLYDDNYLRLADNRLLTQLQIVTNDKPLFVNGQEVQRPQFITVKDNVDSNKSNSKDLTDAWLDLLLDDDLYVRLFARRLIVYAFLSSGEFKGWNKLFKYIPPEFIHGDVDTDYKSFSDFIREQLRDNIHMSDSDIDELVANNSDDFHFVKRMPKEDENHQKNIVAYNDAALILKPININNLEDLNNLPQYLYIKNEKQSTYCRDSKALYKYIGTVRDGGECTYPVYIRIRHRGYHFLNNDIYEYGWDFNYSENNPSILNGLDASTVIRRASNFIGAHSYLRNNGFIDFLKRLETAIYTEDPQTPQNNETLISTSSMPDKHILHSGGADGSDSYWGEIGLQYGVTKQNHYYHGSKTPKGNVVQSEEDFIEGLSKAKAAAAAMKRTWRDEYKDLFARNWNQVKYADVIYAVGHIVRPGEKNSKGFDVLSTQVDGGTGYAVLMAINEGKPVVVFDQEVEKWYVWSYSEGDFIEAGIPGGLADNFAGIGTRRINEAGKQAIRDVYKNTFGDSKPPQAPPAPQPPAQQAYIETASAVIERATLESDRTILSNEELAVWNEAGVGDNPRILVATEHSDPAFHSELIISVIEGKTKVKQSPEYVDITKEEYDSLPKNLRWHNLATDKYFRIKERPQITGKDFAGLYIITKHDGLPLLNLLKTDIPKLIHFSITGLGSTKWEPGSMKPDDLLDRIHDYIKQGLDPSAVTVRIDPIVPGVTTPRMIEHIIQRASEMGIKRIRFSIMDTYGNTVRKMTALGYDFNNKYHWGEEEKLVKGRVIRVKKLLPNDDVVNSICDFMLEMKDKYGVTLGTCAENIHREGISNEGCLSVEGVNRMLGTSIEDKGTDNNKQRLLCSCYGGKVDALAYDDYCGTSCTYCYGKHENDAVHQYYYPEGILKYGTYEDDMLIASRSFVSPKTGIPQNRRGFDINDISGKTEAYGVQIDPELKDNFEDWQEDNPNGIVAYRVPFKTYDTVENVRKGRIGNPFSEGNSRGPETVQYFYDWLVGGINPDPVKFPKATEEFRLAIVDKIKSTPKGSPILYYKELGRPSHATVIGYLIANYGKDPRETRLSILKESKKPETTTFTFNDGTAVDAPFEVNDEQSAALNDMLDFVNSDEDHMTLSGYAGTGKTSIMEILAKKLSSSYRIVQFCATTHTAAGVLQSKVKSSGYSVSTVQSLFGVNVDVDEESELYDAGEKKQIDTGKSRVKYGSIVIIDEASMINEDIYKIINRIVNYKSAKVIYVGDPKQLPPVGETQISVIFRDKSNKVSQLTRVMRTGDNAILKEATAIRNGESFSKESSFNNEGVGVAFIERGKNKELVKDIIKAFAKGIGSNPNFFKILTYSRASVSNYNDAVRVVLGYKGSMPTVGEPITGYRNWGFKREVDGNSWKFVNSRTYTVVKVNAPTEILYNTLTFDAIPVTLKDEGGEEVNVNLIDIKANMRNLQNAEVLSKVIKQLWGEFRKSKSSIEKEIIRNQINEIEDFLFINDVVYDKDHVNRRGEHPVIHEKVFDYGYAITVHKAQGSTYTNVLIDDYNIVRTSRAHVESQELHKEYIQQLEYVAVSRATDTATVLTTDVKKEDSPLNHIHQINKSNLPGPEVEMDIWAGKNPQNPDLSNVAERPFTFIPEDYSFGADRREKRFNSVEQAFQYYKMLILELAVNILNYPSTTQTQDDLRKSKRINSETILRRADEILNSDDGFEAKRLGDKRLDIVPFIGTAHRPDGTTLEKLITSSSEIEKAIFSMYDSVSPRLMKALIKASFEQNPQALQRLLATGHATFTHTRDKSKWGEEFPRILMLVRSELASEQQKQITQQNDAC